ADPYEGDAVAMSRVHVRLNLEHEPTELGAGGIDERFACRPRAGRRGNLGEPVQERFEAEVGQGAAEVDPRPPARQILCEVEPRACGRHEIHAFEKLIVDGLADEFADARVRMTGDLHGRTSLALCVL